MAYEAYITEAYYTETYQGAEIGSADFSRIALRASDEVDLLTFGRVRTAGLSSFDSNTQEAVMLATCAMAEALAQIDAATDGSGVVTSSEKVGSYSYSTDAASLASLKATALSKARGYLWRTGLLYSGVRR